MPAHDCINSLQCDHLSVYQHSLAYHMCGAKPLLYTRSSIYTGTVHDVHWLYTAREQLREQLSHMSCFRYWTIPGTYSSWYIASTYRVLTFFCWYIQYPVHRYLVHTWYIPGTQLVHSRNCTSIYHPLHMCCAKHAIDVLQPCEQDCVAFDMPLSLLNNPNQLVDSLHRRSISFHVILRILHTRPSPCNI